MLIDFLHVLLYILDMVKLNQLGPSLSTLLTLKIKKGGKMESLQLWDRLPFSLRLYSQNVCYFLRCHDDFYGKTHFHFIIDVTTL